ncbi:type 4a pilus biogenesis protein PilO [Actinotalea sp.]|uniref:type 4a pilus biogenesis protein PilO n=1 Tax=Actinotalea sp. TaxID=1872145 RepID=UPI002CE75F42|nr:type 4a pilus biogenesis protein PilO [Actinotalea sp.]HQY33847.1 type 4a pilus biogenesis protein PilO [Actinotalea sp.]HRA50013.1 type 4a pilus biogenesis protein PilO [Actinotalea sp.]
MGTNKRITWVVGTTFLALILFAGAWFLLIGPNVDAIAEARQSTEDTLAQNEVQTRRLATLKEQFADLASYRAELATIRTQLPVEDGLPALLRELDTLATGAGVTIVGVAPAIPETFFAAAPVDVAPTNEAPASDTATEDGAAAPAPAPVEPVGVDGLVAIPVSITVLGSYDATVDFVEGLQTRMARLFVVTAFTAEGQEENEATGGKPATREGDAEFTISGVIYVLQDTAAATDAAAPDAGDTGTSGETDS